MTDGTKRLLLFMILALGVAGGAAAAKYLHKPAPTTRTPTAAELQDTFAATASVAMQSVVHITTSTGADQDLFGTLENVGSGIIVSKDGHILTNNHVIENARELRVRFSDGKEYAARVVGTDPESDLALLQFQPERGQTLVPAALGDSDAARVGDWVLAIGSPFGYNHTVTVGIVSAKHRRAQLNLPYQDFIQTDAAINPGNSGGALVNLKGEVVGINTAMVSESRGNEGVGLAISVNLAKWVMERLLRDGRVRRGFLGIVPHDFDRELVMMLRGDGYGSLEEILKDRGLAEPQGVYVVEVQPESPAARAGLRPHDVILEFDGRAIAGQSDMFFRVAEAKPGSTVSMKVLRDQAVREVQVGLAERQPRDLYGRRKRE